MTPEEHDDLLKQLTEDGLKPKVKSMGDVDMISLHFPPAGPDDPPPKPGPPPPDPASEAGAEALLADAKAFARGTFEEHGAVRIPTVTFLAHRDPNTYQTLEKPAHIICPIDNDMMANARSKDRLAGFLRTMARATEAFGYVMVHEAWYLKGDAAKDPDRSKSFEHVPGRGEAVMAIAQHVAWGDKTRGEAAEITRDAAGNPTLGEWQKWDSLSGRFADVLPTAAQRTAARESFDMIVEWARLGWSKERMFHTIREMRDRYRRAGDSWMAEGCAYLMQRIKERDV